MFHDPLTAPAALFRKVKQPQMWELEQTSLPRSYVKMDRSSTDRKAENDRFHRSRQHVKNCHSHISNYNYKGVAQGLRVIGCVCMDIDDDIKFQIINEGGICRYEYV